MKEVAALVEGGRGRKRRSSLQSTRHSGRRADGRIVTSGRASLQRCLIPDRDPVNFFLRMPPRAPQSSGPHPRGIISSCGSKRNRSSSPCRINTPRLNGSGAARRGGRDRLKGISEWTKSELCCAFTRAEPRAHHLGNHPGECVASGIQI